MNDQPKSSAASALRSQDPFSVGSSRNPMRIEAHERSQVVKTRMAEEKSTNSTSPPKEQTAAPKSTPTKPQRRWYQFSLRTFLVLVLLVSIGLSWLAVKREQANRQREAVKAILDLGGTVSYDYEWDEFAGKKESMASARLRSLFGDDLFHDVETVQLRWVQSKGAVVNQVDGETRLAGLGEFDGLKQLDLYFSEITDRELSHIKTLTKLEDLSLVGNPVTDAGLQHLKLLTNLRKLNLHSIRLTDAGMVHLKGLTNLTSLNLGGTKITGAGLAHLEGLTNLETLILDNETTDAGLVHLKGLTNLTFLNLGSKVTDAGLVHLEGLTNLEKLNLSGTKITDAGLEHLQGLTNLRDLLLYRTRVTDEGVRRLEQALPNCEINHVTR